MLLQLSHFPLFTPLHPAHPLPPTLPLLQFMSMGHTYKFFGFYISYTILTLPLSIFYLLCMLFILCTFPPLSPPTPQLITHQVISISVILSCSSCLLSLCLFLFQVWLLITVAILLLQVLSFIQKYSKIFYDCFGVKMHIISYPKSLFFPLWP